MMELAVPSVPQTTGHSCGPASLLSCLRYLGTAGKASEASLIRETNCTSSYGTATHRLIAAARKRVPRAYFAEGLSVDDLRGFVASGKLAIMLIQAWRPDERLATPWRANFDDGHYAVLVSVGKRTVYFADPSLKGARARLSIRELGERWHDKDNPGDGERHIHNGAIIIEGPTPRLRRLGRTRPMG